MTNWWCAILARRTATMVALGVLALAAAPAIAQEPTPPPWLQVQNGQTQPQFAFDQAIEEVVFVETELDSDHDAAPRPRPDPDQPATRGADRGLQGPGHLRAQPLPG